MLGHSQLGRDDLNHLPPFMPDDLTPGERRLTVTALPGLVADHSAGLRRKGPRMAGMTRLSARPLARPSAQALSFLQRWQVSRRRAAGVV